MTNYSCWDEKATALCRDAAEDDERDEAMCNVALGLGAGPRGPTTAKAESELKQLQDHSKQREDFIAWSKDREVVVSHAAQADSNPVVLSGSGIEAKALHIKGSQGVTYILPESTRILKLTMSECRDVNIQLQTTLLTSTLELYKCAHLEVQLDCPLGTLQVDECIQAVCVHFAEKEHFGKAYHQNSPGFTLGWAGPAVEPISVGKAGAFQLVTYLAGALLHTDPVRRGEGEFPIDLNEGEVHARETPGDVTLSAEDRNREAEKQRLAGNDMFCASDFAQAAALYSLALQLDPEHSVVWANRAQCWLKLGDHEKALADASSSTRIDPFNSKGWFRKGIALHALKRYADAISDLLEAEKIEPTNKQILDAIKMSQLMARREGGA